MNNYLIHERLLAVPDRFRPHILAFPLIYMILSVCLVCIFYLGFIAFYWILHLFLKYELWDCRTVRR